MDAKARTRRSRIAARAKHAKHDPRKGTEAARRVANYERFRDEVLEAAATNGEDLNADEIEARIRHLRTANMLRLADLSAKKRAKS